MQRTFLEAPHGKFSIACILFKSFLSDTDFKLLHHANAFLPINSTVSGNKILSILIQLQKAFVPILLMLVGRQIFLSLEHF